MPMRTRQKSGPIAVVDRAQAVMAGGAAAALDLELARREVDLVVDDGDLLGRDLVEARGGADRHRPRRS